MKKVIITLIILHFSFIIANAQWIWQNSGTTSPIFDIEFINRYTGWACGDGVILKTTNAGTNWIIQNHPATNKTLNSVNPINENICYCVGYFETILKTTNGGMNWIAIRNGPVGSGASYWASHFINENTGWIAGSNQKILKTTNGGVTFDSIYLFVGNIMDIYFKDSLYGFLCGVGGLTRKTTNGGYNWFTPNIQLNGNLYNFYKMSFINNQYGWLVGNGNPVYRTTDFGSNWDSIGYVTGSNEIYTSRFSSVSTGWAGGTYGKFFKTTNSGYTWNRENTSNFTGYISGIYFYNDSVGWIVGGGGRIQYTTTSGQVMQIANSQEQIANEIMLYQNYPNPFNQITNIKYQIAKSENGKWKIENSFITIKVFDVLGKEISTLVNENQTPETYETRFDCRSLSAGIYFYSLFSDGHIIDTKKLVLLK